MIRPVTVAVLCALVTSAIADEKKDAKSRANELESLKTELKASQVNVIAKDGHPNLLTDTHAISVLWSKDWSNAIGHAANGAATTGKRPAVILLITPGAAPGVAPCKEACKYLGIQLSIRDIVTHTTTVQYEPSPAYSDALDAIRDLAARAAKPEKK